MRKITSLAAAVMTTADPHLHPLTEPYATHRIAVGGGHELYVEEVGRPDGVPAVFLHGGPGDGLVPAARRFFDPDRYRVVLFDQRGGGAEHPGGRPAGQHHLTPRRRPGGYVSSLPTGCPV